MTNVTATGNYAHSAGVILQSFSLSYIRQSVFALNLADFNSVLSIKNSEQLNWISNVEIYNNTAGTNTIEISESSIKFISTKIY